MGDVTFHRQLHLWFVLAKPLWRFFLVETRSCLRCLRLPFSTSRITTVCHRTYMRSSYSSSLASPTTFIILSLVSRYLYTFNGEGAPFSPAAERCRDVCYIWVDLILSLWFLRLNLIRIMKSDFNERISSHTKAISVTQPGNDSSCHVLLHVTSLIEN